MKTITHKTRNSNTSARSVTLSLFKTLVAAIAMVLASVPSLSWADATWVGDTSQDWNNAANWSSDPADPTGNFYVNTNAAGVFPIINADSAFSPTDIYIGIGTNVMGRLDQTAGAASVGDGNWLRMGEDSGNGTFNLSGGTFTGIVHMAYTVGGSATATINVTGTGTLSVPAQTYVSAGDNNVSESVGTLNVSGGGTVNSEHDVIICWAGNSNSIGTLNITAGGTVNVATATERWLIVNQWDTAQGRIVVDGGTLNLNANTDIRFSPGNGVGTSSITLSGGGAITGGSGSVVDLNRGAGTVDNTFNLNGGTLTIGQIISGVTSGSRVFNFNGGTLKPAASSASFFPADSASEANVMAGGAVIDTAGFDITIAQTLQDGGGGGLTKQGTGTLTLSAGNSYTGPTIVEAGTLTLDATPYPFYGNMTVSDGAVLDLFLNNGLSSVTVGALTFNGNATLDVNFGSATMPATALYANSVANTGTTTINIKATSLPVGQYQLIYTGGSVPTNNFVLGPLPTGVQAHLADSGTSLDLVITASVQILTWYGANSGGTPLTTWDINTSSNWNSGMSVYKEYGDYGDNVTFDDNANFGSTNVNLSTRVVPLSVTVSSFGLAYNITGTGGIDGQTSLLVTNSGSVFLATSNNYTGGTIIAGDGFGGGSLIITNDNALGTNSASATLAGGALELALNGTISRAIDVINSQSSIRVPAGDTVQYTGSITGSSGVSKTGDGVLELPNPDAISVTATVTAGTLKLSNADAVTNGTVGVGIDNGLVFDTGIGTFNLGGLSGASALALTDTGASPVTLTVGTNDAGSQYQGVLSGSGSLVKIGSGVFRLNGNNTYSGGTTVSGGELAAQAEGTPRAITPFGSGAVNVNNGAIATLGGGPGDAFGSYSYANNFNLVDDGRLWAWDASQRVLGNVNIGAGGGRIGSTFNAPWENFAETNFPKGIFIDGFITGTGPLTVAHPGWSVGNQWNTSCAVFTSQGTPSQNTYSGDVTVNPLTGGNGGSYLYLVGTEVMANATITLTGDNTAALGRMGISTLLFGNGSLDGPGYCTIGGLAGSGSVLLADTILFTGGAGYSNGIPVALSVGYNNANTTYSGAMFGPGSLVKIGTGTLTLSGPNTYTGDTTVSAGTLELAQSSPTLTTNSTVSIANGAFLQLTDGAVMNTVTNLVLAGVSQPVGVYNSGNSGGRITGSGSLQVIVPGVTPPPPATLTNSFSGGMLSLSWPAGEGWQLQMQTNSLSAGLGTNWESITDGSVSSTNIPVDATKPTVFYRLIYTP